MPGPDSRTPAGREARAGALSGSPRTAARPRTRRGLAGPRGQLLAARGRRGLAAVAGPGAGDLLDLGRGVPQRGARSRRPRPRTRSASRPPWSRTTAAAAARTRSPASPGSATRPRSPPPAATRCTSGPANRRPSTHRSRYPGTAACTPVGCQKSACPVGCSDGQGSAVGHHDHPCPSACSISSSCGCAAGWSCLLGRRPPRTPSSWCGGMRSLCCAGPIRGPGWTGPTGRCSPR